MKGLVVLLLLLATLSMVYTSNIFWQANTILVQNIELTTTTSIAFYANASCSMPVLCWTFDFYNYQYYQITFENMTQHVIQNFTSLSPGFTYELQCSCDGTTVQSVFSQTTLVTTHPPIPIATYNTYSNSLSWEFTPANLVSYNITFTEPFYLYHQNNTVGLTLPPPIMGVPYVYTIVAKLHSMTSTYSGQFMHSIPPLSINRINQNTFTWSFYTFILSPSSLYYTVCLDAVVVNVVSNCTTIQNRDQNSISYFHLLTNQQYMFNVTAYTPYASSVTSVYRFHLGVVPPQFIITPISKHSTNITWTSINPNQQYISYYLSCTNPISLMYTPVTSPLLLSTIEASTYTCSFMIKSTILDDSDHMFDFAFATFGSSITNLQFQSITMNSVKIVFVPIVGILHYEYTISNNTTTYSYHSNISLTTTQGWIELYHLNPTVKYAFTIYPNPLFYNASTFWFSTLPTPPENITVTLVSTTFVQLQWNACVGTSGPFVYKVCSLFHCINTTNPTIVLHNLIPNSVTQFQFFTIDSFGMVSNATVYSVYTLPESVTILHKSNPMQFIYHCINKGI